MVDVEQVIRYFVVHKYVCSGDSYTGSMIHNYYLYEEDGQISIIDNAYNLIKSYRHPKALLVICRRICRRALTEKYLRALTRLIFRKASRAVYPDNPLTT